MLEGKQLEHAIAATPGDKVQLQDMLKRIQDVKYMTLEAVDSPTVTICNVVLDNGYSVRGESACVDRRNFSVEIGQSVAYKDAVEKLWPLFGFLLAEDRHRRKPTISLKDATVAISAICLLFFAGCSLVPVEETKYLHFETGETIRIDRQHGHLLDTRKVYEVEGTDQHVWGHWVCNKVQGTHTEHCLVRKLKS